MKVEHQLWEAQCWWQHGVELVYYLEADEKEPRSPQDEKERLWRDERQ